jgi:hypothetical protein
MNRVGAAAAALGATLAALVVGGCSSGSSHAAQEAGSVARAPATTVAPTTTTAPTKYTLKLTIFSGDCQMGHFSEDAFGGPGTQVTVKDANGSIIGMGTAGNATAPCGFPVTVSDLGQSNYYSIVPGSGSPYTLSFSQAQADNWTLTLVAQTGSATQPPCGASC